MGNHHVTLRLAVGLGAIAALAISVTPVGAIPLPFAAEEPPPEPVPGTKIREESRYRTLSTFWTQVDTAPDGTPVPPGTAPFGNVHVGFMDIYAYQSEVTTKIPGQPRETVPTDELFAFVHIRDFDCPVGVLPPTGGGHGEPIVDLADPALADPDRLEQAVADAAAELAVEEPPAGGCVHIGLRNGEQDGLTIEIDRRLRTATAKGFLLMYSGGDPHSGEPGTVVGRPRVDVVWTGVGDVGRGEYTGKYRRGTQRFQYAGTSRDREATMGGILGPMGFAPDLSGGSMSTGESSSKQVF